MCLRTDRRRPCVKIVITPGRDCKSPSICAKQENLKCHVLFLQELQFSRIEGAVKGYKEDLVKKRQEKIDRARTHQQLVECVCCYNDECLVEEMLPCNGGHLFCTECVQRASEVKRNRNIL